MGKVKRFLAIIVLFLFAVSIGSCGGGGGGGTGSTPPPPTTENFNLTVEKFGEGIVVDNRSGINCGSNCSKTYAKDTSIVLTATEGSGSVFKSWAGCDSVAANICTVTMDSNKTVTITFALSEFKYQLTTKFLDDATMLHLIKQEDTIYYFDSQATTVKDIRPGDVVMSSSDKGLLRRVTAVSVLPDGSFAVETTDATLEDAIEKGTIAFTGKLTHAQLKAPVNLIRGVRLQEALKAESVDFSFFIDTTISDDAGNSIKITGSFITNFEPDFALTIDKKWGIIPKLDEFKFILFTKNTQSLSVAGNINLIDKKVKLTQKPLTWTVPTKIGPVIIEGDLYLGVKGTANATMKVTTEVIYTAGVYYKTETDWKTVNTWSHKVGSVDNVPNTSATASVKPYIRPELKTLLWGLIGPYANVDGYFKLEAGVSSPLWWKLYGGVDASIGAKVEKISQVVPSIGFTFNIIEWEIASSVAQQNQIPIISLVTANPSSVKTGEISTITCIASDLDNDPLTYVWTKTGGSFSGSGSTVIWTAPSTAGTYTVTCNVSDGKPGGTASRSAILTVTESTTPLSITTISLPSGTVGVSYPATNLSATGGKLPYSWSWSGNTPPVLSLNTSGVISGTPTTTGTYNFTVKVTDSSSPQQTATKALSINITSGTLSAPTGLTATPKCDGSTPGIELKWNAVTGANKYEVYRNGSLIYTTGSNPYFWNTSGLTAGQNYQYQVKARNDTTTSDFSGSVTATAPNCSGYSISGRVTLNGSGLSGVTITLTGAASTTATTSSDGNYTFTGAQNGSYTITPSKSGYTFNPSSRPIAVNNANVTGQDFTASPLSDITPPSVPSGLTATAVSSNQINLYWNASTDNVGVAGYKVYDSIGTLLKSVSITSTSFTGLNPNTQYCFRVSAYDAANNESGKSEQRCATTSSGGSAPIAITNAATNVTSSSATLNGTVNPNGLPTDVWFRYGTTPSYGSATSMQSIGSGTSSLSVSQFLAGLSPSTTYYYQIIAYNSNGTTYGTNAPQTFTTSSTGKAVTVANTSGIGLNLRNCASTSCSVIASLPEGTQMNVIGGPVQAEGYTWWNITGISGTGWSAVGEWLTPAPQVGITVTVTYTGGLGLRLRNCANLSCSIITTLPEGTQMNVFSGPTQADGYTWWAIQGYMGGTLYTGWSAVGNWLVPNPRY
jgi:hypothetical protein